ncbi:hypothetical protein KY284_008172 [Solanum tuberosum]|nr:hypothetical protein KY284_008172 [Solanum tuberosum]
MSNLPDHVRMDIEDESTRAIRTFKVNIQYDYLPKNCGECKLQGHNIYECRIMHPELAREQIDNKEKDKKRKEPNQEGEAKNKTRRAMKQGLISLLALFLGSWQVENW